MSTPVAFYDDQVVLEAAAGVRDRRGDAAWAVAIEGGPVVVRDRDGVPVDAVGADDAAWASDLLDQIPAGGRVVLDVRGGGVSLEAEPWRGGRGAAAGDARFARRRDVDRGDLPSFPRPQRAS